MNVDEMVEVFNILKVNGDVIDFGVFNFMLL